MQAFSDIHITIVENSTDIQAISWGDDYIGASFYNSDKVLKSKNWEISVSAPCTLMFEKDSRNLRLSITDAEMNKDLKSIEVKTTLPISGNNVSKDKKWNVVSVPMPQGKWCGKHATVQLKAN